MAENSKTKYVPKIEFGPMIHPEVPHVIHLVPFIRTEGGENKIMKGHNFKATCCQVDIIRGGNGQAMVKHSVIH